MRERNQSTSHMQRVPTNIRNSGNIIKKSHYSYCHLPSDQDKLFPKYRHSLLLFSLQSSIFIFKKKNEIEGLMNEHLHSPNNANRFIPLVYTRNRQDKDVTGRKQIENQKRSRSDMGPLERIFIKPEHSFQ